MNEFNNLEPSRDGFYALISKVIPGSSDQDYLELFSEFGKVISVKTEAPFVFTRYENKSEAVKCILTLRQRNFWIRPATNKSLPPNTLEPKLDKNKKVTNSSSECSNMIKKVNLNSHEHQTSVSHTTNNNNSTKLILGKRNDANTHLFISNLAESVTRKHLLQMLEDYFVYNLSDIYTTLPYQSSVNVRYVVVTMPMKDAIKAMENLNFVGFMGKRMMCMEVQTMYTQAISPLAPKEDKSLLPPTLEEIQSRCRPPSCTHSSNSSSKNPKFVKTPKQNKKYFKKVP